MTQQERKQTGNAEDGWNIYDALREPRTDFEANPPGALGYDQACVPLSVALGDSLHGVIRHTEHEYGMGSKSQSAQRLLRVGFQEIESPRYSQVGEMDLSKLKAYRDVVFKFVPSIGENKFGYSALRQKQPLSVGFGWGSENRKESFSIFWYQREQCKTHKDQLRIPLADIFRWGIVNATVAMGEVGLIDSSEANNAEAIQQSIVERVEERIEFTQDVAMSCISKAYHKGDSDRVAEYCQRTVPELWHEFKRTTNSNHSSLKEDEFLYPVEF